MSENQTTATDQAQTQSATPEKYVIDGVEYTPEQLKEFISKGTDYTKKTQELANQRKEIEQFRQEYEVLAPYGDFIKSLDTDTELQQEVIRTLQGVQQRRAQGLAPTQQQVNTLKQAAKESDDDGAASAVDQLRADIELEREIDKLSRKYDDFDEKEVLAYAEEHGIEDLEAAYKAMNFDSAQEKAAQKALENAKKGAQVPRTQGGGSGTPPGTEVQTPKTWKEARQAAQEQWRQMRES